MPAQGNREAVVRRARTSVEGNSRTMRSRCRARMIVERLFSLVSGAAAARALDAQPTPARRTEQLHGKLRAGHGG